MMENVSFDTVFCDNLDRHLTLAFQKSENIQVNRFFGDGVLMPFNEHLLRKRVNDTRKIETTAWALSDSNRKFELLIHFGKYSLRRYARGTRLEDCLPEPEWNKNVWIDLENDRIELQLL